MWPNYAQQPTAMQPVVQGILVTAETDSGYEFNMQCQCYLNTLNGEADCTKTNQCKEQMSGFWVV